MKFLSLAAAALLCGNAAAKSKKSKKDEGPVCPAINGLSRPSKINTYPVKDNKHYLVGLLTFEFGLDGYTTGVKALESPLTSIPNVGVTDMSICYENVPIVDDKTGLTTGFLYVRKPGFYVLLKDEGYGTSAVSEDFPLHYHLAQPQKPFVYNHGDTKFEIYTPFEPLATNLITDPDKLVSWKSEWDGHLLDIQTAYYAPDDWTDLVEIRTLTGRDFSPEGISNIREDCSVIGEKWGPSIFSIDTLTGAVTSPIVQIPDVFNLTHPVLLDDYFLTTVSDKRHCYLHEVVANECGIVENERVDSNGYFTYVKNDDGKKEKVFVPKYHRISPTAGWASLAYIYQANIIYGIFNERVNYITPSGDSEPGVRIYSIYPGDCTADCPPFVSGFVGWYKLSPNTNRVAAMAPIQSSNDRFLVHEHNSGFPDGKFMPRFTSGMPMDKICIVQINLEKPVQDNKVCILNYMHISDPYDVDHNGSGIYAQSQKSNSALAVIDDYCFWGGTDPGWPLSARNDYDLTADEVPFYVEAVESTRFFMVCYYEPIFNIGYDFMEFH